jgi:hypothetical protein
MSYRYLVEVLLIRMALGTPEKNVYLVSRAAMSIVH